MGAEMGFGSPGESLDTTTPGGKLVFPVFASVAEFERDVIRERTMAGLEAAKTSGRKDGGRPVMDEKKPALASRLMKDRETPMGEVCEAGEWSDAIRASKTGRLLEKWWSGWRANFVVDGFGV